MSDARRLSVTIVTIADGSATGYIGTGDPLTGKLIYIGYTKAGSANYTDGVDFVATVEDTTQAVWTGTNVNASTQVYPRHPVSDYAGAASLYAALGEPVEDHIYLANDRIKIVIAAGGDTKTGTFYALVA